MRSATRRQTGIWTDLNDFLQDGPILFVVISIIIGIIIIISFLLVWSSLLVRILG